VHRQEHAGRELRVAQRPVERDHRQLEDVSC
jgi:hypothetical protein